VFANKSPASRGRDCDEMSAVLSRAGMHRFNTHPPRGVVAPWQSFFWCFLQPGRSLYTAAATNAIAPPTRKPASISLMAAESGMDFFAYSSH